MTAPTIITLDNGEDVVVRKMGGQQVVLVLPNVPSDAPEDVREGFTRRRHTMITGRCVCGATFNMPSRAARRRARKTGNEITSTYAQHENDCPARDSIILEAIARWQR